MDMQGLAIFLEKGMRNKCDGAGIFIIEHSNSNASANSNGMQAHAMQIKSIQLPIPNQIVSSVQWNGIQFKANSNSMQMQFKFNSKSNRKIQKRPRCLMNPSMTSSSSSTTTTAAVHNAQGRPTTPRGVGSKQRRLQRLHTNHIVPRTSKRSRIVIACRQRGA